MPRRLIWIGLVVVFSKVPQQIPYVGQRAERAYQDQQFFDLAGVVPYA